MNPGQARPHLLDPIQKTPGSAQHCVIGFGGPRKPTRQRPVLPRSSRPNGAAVFQPRASAAPPWERSAPHYLESSPRHRKQASHTSTERQTTAPKAKAAAEPPQSKTYRVVECASSCMARTAPNCRNGFRRAAANRPATGRCSHGHRTPYSEPVESFGLEAYVDSAFQMEIPDGGRAARASADRTTVALWS